MHSGCRARSPLRAQPFASSVSSPLPSPPQSQKSIPTPLSCLWPPVIFRRALRPGYTRRFPRECAAPATSSSRPLPQCHSIYCKLRKRGCRRQTAAPRSVSTSHWTCSSSSLPVHHHAHRYLSLLALRSPLLPCPRSPGMFAPLSCFPHRSPPAGHPSCRRNTASFHLGSPAIHAASRMGDSSPLPAFRLRQPQ